jgi:hypothetical protein
VNEVKQAHYDFSDEEEVNGEEKDPFYLPNLWLSITKVDGEMPQLQ